MARESSILGRLIDGNERDGEVERPHDGLTISRNHEARTLIYNYSAPTRDPSDVAAMKLANPASWVSEAFLAKQAASHELSSAEVLQLHGCVWAASAGSWIQDEAWHGCFVHGLELPADGARVVAGVDVAQRHDHSAVSLAWELPGGRVGVSARVWEPRESEGRSRVLDVEQYVRELSGRYDLTVVFDERFFNRSAEVLSDEGVDLHELPQQGKHMADAYQGFYQAAVERRLAHAGGVLGQHVLGCSAEMTERGWRIRKLRQSQKIDAAVAAVMAVWGLGAIVRKPVYVSGGFS